MTQQVSEHEGFDGVLYDISKPHWPVEIQISGQQLWVNIGPVCVLRIQRRDIPLTLHVNGEKEILP